MNLCEPLTPPLTSAHSAPLLPEWLTVPAACRRSSLGRTTIYALLSDGRIRGKLVKTRATNLRGKRLILRASLDAFLDDTAAN